MRMTLKRIFQTAVFGLACLMLFPALAFANNQVITYDDGVSDDTTHLSVAKRDADDRTYVQGATLAILDEGGNQLVSWVTTDSPMSFDRFLNEGAPLNVDTTYILRELEAPKGYDVAEDARFHIDQYGTLVVESGPSAETADGRTLDIYDVKLVAQDQKDGKKSKLSKTGDSIEFSAVAAGSAVIIVCAIALIVVSARKRARS